MCQNAANATVKSTHPMQIETIDPRGAFFNTTNEYDAAGLLAKTTKPTGTPENPGEDASWLYRYDALGNQLEVEDPRGS